MGHDADISATLAELGLGDKEITVYLALLGVGTAPASSLSKRTGITRSTTQYVCNQLVKKGIASLGQKEAVFLFTAEPPDRLLLMLERKRDALRQTENRVQRIIGPLKQMMNVHAALPQVRFYEGREGMIQLYDSILDMRSPIDSFEENGALLKMFAEYPHEFVRKRIERKIPNRCIAPRGSPFNESDPEKFLEVRTVDAKRFPFTWHIKICQNVVGIFSFEEGAAVGIGIEHADLARNFRLLFELVWESLDAGKPRQRGRSASR